VLVLAFIGIEQSFRRQITSFHVILIVYFERERGGDIMVTKRVLIAAVLATFCLTATLFMIVPTRSQSGSYDPWTDINGDGKIDMADISMAIDGFMSSGDATKPVNITGHATELIVLASGLPISGSWASPNILVDGYSKVTVSISGSSSSTFRLYGYDGTNSFLEETVYPVISSGFVKTYDVPNQYIWISISAASVTIYVDVYLVA
jgi:hypothetical protein